MPAKDDMLVNYKKTIQEIRNLLKGKVELESDPILETNFHQRYHLKPDGKIKLLLLAESHMFTSEEDHKITVQQLKSFPDYVYQKGSNQYTKFIYCLGHGEKGILSARPKRLGSTPQFWKIFYGLFHNLSLEKNAQNIPVLKTHTRDLRTRLTEKVNVLQKMKDNGIWLLDASPVAIAGNDGVYLYYKKIMEISYKYYLKPLLDKIKPTKTVIIGKGVSKKIKPLMDLQNVETVPQPQGIRSKNELKQFHKQIFDLGQEAINHV